MNKPTALCLFGFLAAAGLPSQARLSMPDIQTYTQGVVLHKNASSGQWARSLRSPGANAPKGIVTSPDAEFAPVSYWGTLSTPEGEEWMYTADYTYTETPDGSEFISKAFFTIYDAKFNVYSTFTANFELGENETGINTVQMAPTLTRKFFNINDAYEVMIMVHATTVDYTGHIYTQAYTLSDGSLVATIEGNNIDAVNTATDSWSENYTMVFMREQMEFSDENYSYNLLFDVYGKAGWGTGCQLKHTFDVNYELVAGAGNYAMPILINTFGNKIYYALPRYEKPYFESSFSEDITPDNHFIIDLYDGSFNLVKTTSIPMAVEGDAAFSFPGLGELFGNEDLSFGLFTDNDQPVYIIGVENYIAGADDFTTSFYVYDWDGNRIKTIVRDVNDYMRLSDIPTQPAQFCFYMPASDLGYFSMVDIPSCREVAYIPLRLGEGEESPNITTSIDRVASGNSYKYVSSLAQAETNDQGDAIHMFAWFNNDGSFDRFDSVNLGQNIALAQPNVASQALNPYLFNTDSSIEYMFLVKEYANPQFSTASDEKFRIYGADNELLLEMGPRKETGEVLNSIFLINTDTQNPKLIVSYYSYNTYEYTLCRINLPLTKLDGGGTAANPYKVSTPGDLMAMYLYPSSHFQVVNDIDFGNSPWDGTKCSFSGVLDGGNHTLKNLNLQGGGIFENLAAGAVVKDLRLEDVSMTAHDICGVISNNAIGESKSPMVTNVHVAGLDVNGSAELFGGLVGFSAGHTTVTLSSVAGVIDLPRATVGGLVGRMSTGSQVTVSAFKGSILNAGVAGGICGETFTGDETIANCHVDADIKASAVAGGILGSSHRTTVDHCLAQGSVAATGDREAYAGGILGSMDSTYEPVEAPVVFDNIVAAEVSANTEASKHIAHRIAGFTSGDEMLVDWDSKDPNVDWSDPSTYPYYNGDSEKGLANNFALCAKIDAEVADAADTTEGQSITVAQLDSAFYAEHGWKLGDSAENPWEVRGELLALYFEDRISSVVSAEFVRPMISVERGIVRAQGQIVIYNLSGSEVRRGQDVLSTESLPRGVYVANAAGGSVKFMVR